MLRGGKKKKEKFYAKCSQFIATDKSPFRCKNMISSKVHKYNK